MSEEDHCDGAARPLELRRSFWYHHRMKFTPKASLTIIATISRMVG
jgi:hypothetical protein